MGIQMSGDFIGFSLGGVHSSLLGVIRTSDGSRYNENLLPSIQDKTTLVPGRDGNYFFGSTFNQKPINIQIAFDGVTREQLTQMKQLYGNKTLQKLIFDEAPDRFYWVKSTGTPSIKYIPFDNDEKNEYIYKGEGTLSFVAYDPFAYSTEEFVKKIDFKYTKDKIAGSSTLYNEGDLETDWKIIIKPTKSWSSGNKLGMAFSLNRENFLEVRDLILENDREEIEINSKTEMAYGRTSGALYNKHLYGNFKKLMPGKNIFGYSCYSGKKTYHVTCLDSISYSFKYY